MKQSTREYAYKIHEFIDRKKMLVDAIDPIIEAYKTLKKTIEADKLPFTTEEIKKFNLMFNMISDLGSNEDPVNEINNITKNSTVNREDL